MKITKLTSIYFSNYISKHGYAHAVAAKNTSINHIEALQKQPAKISKLPNSVIVTSIENYCPIAHISVVIKAGSRYENGRNVGIVHCLRNCAGLATKNLTNFGITRNIQFMGGNVMVSSTREHMVYTLQCLRDNIDTAINYLSEIVSHQALKPWEINDFMPRMNVDLALHQKQPEAVLMEALHKAAFRGGLSNSLYSPSFMVGKHDSKILHQYVKDHFTTQRTVVVGLGVDHEHLGESVTKLFNLEGGAGVIAETSKYGGGEVRIETNHPIAYVGIVAEGAGVGATKEMLSLAVLQQILGASSHVKYSGQNSKLSVAASKATNGPFMVSSININYSDTGLFGVYLAGQPDDMQQLVKAVVTQMKEMTKSVLDQDIKIAKQKLKAKLHFSRESLTEQMEEIALQAITNGQLTSIEEIEKSIDALTASDVALVASKVMKTKPAMAAVGPLYQTPHLDELI